MNGITESIVTIATAIVGLAIVAVLVSNKAQTGSVLGAAGSAFANAISAATGPVTGTSATPNLTVGTSGNSGFSLGNLMLPGSIAG